LSAVLANVKHSIIGLYMLRHSTTDPEPKTTKEKRTSTVVHRGFVTWPAQDLALFIREIQS